MSPRAWRCPTCDLLFVVEREPRLRCLTAHHCHLGDRIVCADGLTLAAVGGPDCCPVDVYPTADL